METNLFLQRYEHANQAFLSSKLRNESSCQFSLLFAKATTETPAHVRTRAFSILCFLKKTVIVSDHAIVISFPFSADSYRPLRIFMTRTPSSAEAIGALSFRTQSTKCSTSAS